jgi:D-alanyl-lipoteichoic acid acyltransferase DltB (MBOAT superfamily)
MLWGLFKKMVIADNCALIVNQIFSDYHQYSGSTLLLGAVLFAFQIYGDFSGYSDIAIGSTKLFGFKLKRNFAYPYFSRDIAEFWRRWHISLTTWFRDYVYIPLGGSRGSMWMKTRNIFIVFLVSGFWHGANWTFITWGFINACCFLPLLLIKRNRNNIDIIAHNRLFPSIKEVFQRSVTFSVVVLGWIFFRSESVTSAIEYIAIIFSKSLFSIPYAFGVGTSKAVLTISSIIILIVIEWFGRKKETPISIDHVNGKLVQWGICFVMAIVIFLFMEQQQSFIYFQF